MLYSPTLLLAPGVNPWTISRLESGNWPGGSRPATVRKLAEALGIDPHELLKDED